MSLFASFFLESATQSRSASFLNETGPRADDASLPDSPDVNDSTESVANSSVPAIPREAFEVLPTLLTNEANAAEAESEDESSYAGQTILSSAPSDTIVNIDRVGQTDTNPWPLPRADATSHPLSVSTAASCYMELNGEGENNFPRQDSFASLSFHASGMDSSIAFSHSSKADDVTNEQAIVPRVSPSRSDNHNSDQITNTASFPSLESHSALPLQSTTIVLPHRSDSNPLNSRRLQDWYAQFNESDWDNLRQRAQMAVRALHLTMPSTRPMLRPFYLPPSPPPALEGALASHPTISQQEFGVPQCLPSCFVCPICQSAIVGALTLDCDCGTTVCSACWEYLLATTQERRSGNIFAMARGLDYEVVSSPINTAVQKDKQCPCCRQSVHNPVPCHALDVALLQLIQGLNASEFGEFQQLYYERLRYWREEVMRRQQEPLCDRGCLLSDEVIAGLIQEEEKLWHQQRAKTRSLRPALQWVPGALRFFVAVVASVGIQVLTQPRGRFLRQIRD